MICISQNIFLQIDYRSFRASETVGDQSIIFWYKIDKVFQALFCAPFYQGIKNSFLFIWPKVFPLQDGAHVSFARLGFGLGLRMRFWHSFGHLLRWDIFAPRRVTHSTRSIRSSRCCCNEHQTWKHCCKSKKPVTAAVCAPNSFLICNTKAPIETCSH